MRQVRLLLAFGFLGLLLFAGFYLSQSIHGGPDDSGAALNQGLSATTTRPGPDFSLMDVAGQAHSASEWTGKVLVVNFWATWCPPCRKEIPMFIELQKAYGEQGLQFIGIAIDEADAVREYIDKTGINYPVLVGDQDAIDTARAYGNLIGALPYTAITDRQRQIVYTHQGEIAREQVEDAIRELL